MGTMAEAMTKGYATWERKAADFYPTPVDVTHSLLPLIQHILKDVKEPTIWEPSCGDGRMSRVLEAAGFDVVSSDLRHHSGYGGPSFDFLYDEPMEKWGWDVRQDCDFIVSNPPFVHARAFIEQALGYCPNVAMLLKGTYWHAANRAKLFETHRPQFWLPLTWRPAFLEAERGKNPLMEVSWAVWTQTETGYAIDGNACVMEPLPRRIYPGYGGLGMLSAMDILEGEIEALTRDIREMGSGAFQIRREGDQDGLGLEEAVDSQAAPVAEVSSDASPEDL